MLTLAAITGLAARAGLRLRGGFHPAPGDGVPQWRGEPPGTVLMLGWAGPAEWPVFAASPEASDGAADPVDRWSRRVVGALADQVGGDAVFPFEGPPWLPFQRWAQRAEPLASSPIGLTIHPLYGLWHSYRGALLLPQRLDLPPPAEPVDPCATCAGRPCLTACPVGAFAPGRYDVAACVAHIAAPAGADCLGEGCLARRACPVGADYCYRPDQAAWYMAAFLRARLAATSP